MGRKEAIGKDMGNRAPGMFRNFQPEVLAISRETEGLEKKVVLLVFGIQVPEMKHLL